MDNDANAAAWAEYRFGSGKGASVMVCLTLGTGIGGGLVIDGRLFRGTYGMAGEWGHMISVPGGHRCECGNRGCWEQYASGNALVREARELASTNSPMAYRLLELMGGDIEAITGPSVTAAALEGEQTAIELLADVGTWLGQGIANLAAALDPDLFVIGGGVSAAGDLLLVPARRMFSRTLTGRGFRAEARLELAHFRNDAGLIGAADLARRAMTEPPESARFGFWPRRKARKAREGGPVTRAYPNHDPDALVRPLKTPESGRVTDLPGVSLSFAPTFRGTGRAATYKHRAVVVRGTGAREVEHQHAEAAEKTSQCQPAHPGWQP